MVIWFQVVNTTAVNVSLPYTAASCLNGSNHEALFALANSSSITLIKMGHLATSITTSILKPFTYVSRLLSGIIPSVLKGNTVQENEDSTASIKLQPVGGDVLVLALSKGLKTFYMLLCLLFSLILLCCQVLSFLFFKVWNYEYGLLPHKSVA